MTATCETCRFFHVTRETPCGNHGLCRKNAPVRVAAEQDGWPGTSDDLWCGEHQPRAAAPAPEADTGALRAALVLLTRAATDMLTGIGVHNERKPEQRIEGPVPRALALAVSNANGAIKATSPRPAMAPETRQVLRDAAAAMSAIALDAATCARLERICKKHVTAIRDHLAAHGGGDE
jgi:hypothetical protein